MINQCISNLTIYDYAEFKFYAEKEFKTDFKSALQHFKESKCEEGPKLAKTILSKFESFKKQLLKNPVYGSKELFDQAWKTFEDTDEVESLKAEMNKMKIRHL